MIDGPVLAIDSSTRGGSVAVGVRGVVVAERILEASAGASSLLMPAVDRAMRDASLAPRDLAAVAVGGGPGSFTGLRIAGATAKALVRALGVPLYAWSGLMAAAAAVPDRARPVCALFDARNGEVFAGCWRFSADGAEELLAPAILRVDELADAVGGWHPALTGDGAVVHREALAEALPTSPVDASAEGAYARGLIRLARIAPARGRVPAPAAWEPEYLRASGAERIAAARRG